MTNIENSELNQLKTLFGQASNNKSFDTYSMRVTESGSPAWNSVRDYINSLAGKYNHDASTFAINSKTGEITAVNPS